MADIPSYGGALSAAQHDVSAPLSLGKSTTGSIAQRTSWRSNEGSRPTAYSSRTRGTTLNWDDDSKPSLPSADKGVGRD
jgi:hypothetical protein